MPHCSSIVIARAPGQLARRLVYSTVVACTVLAPQVSFTTVGLAQTKNDSSAIISPVPPATAEEARAAIIRGYQTLDQAIAAKDVAAFMKVFALDAKFVASGFEFGIIEFQPMLSNMLAPLVEVAQTTELEALEVIGDKATASTRARMRMVAKGPDGKLVVTEVLATGKDSWQASAEGWRITKTLETSQRMWIDGIELGTVTPLSAAEREAIAGELRTFVRPVAGVHAGTGFDDLAFLDDVVGDARVVALGESSHGSSEQFKMKHRIIEYLVRRKGFTVVAFEANWSATDLLDGYVKGGPGSAAAGLERLGYWVWRTEEVKSLIEWMRKENLSRQGQKLLSFTGFDMQLRDIPSPCVLDVFAKLGGPDQAKLQELYEAGSAKSSGPPKSAKELEVLLADIRGRAREALGIVDARRVALVAASSQSEFERARQCARVIVQNADNLDAGLSISVRDQAMADNVHWLADVAHRGEKIILWAHNGHVGVQAPAMGGHLRPLFGKDLVVIGFASHHGEIRANTIKDGKVEGELYSVVGPVPISLAAPAEGSVDDVLNSAGISRFFLDLRKVSTTSVLGQWLTKPQSETTIGWPYDPTKANARSIVLPDTYDGLVFIVRSSASVLLK